MWTEDRKRFRRYICSNCSYYESVTKRDEIDSPNNINLKYNSEIKKAFSGLIAKNLFKH